MARVKKTPVRRERRALTNTELNNRAMRMSRINEDKRAIDRLDILQSRIPLNLRPSGHSLHENGTGTAGVDKEYKVAELLEREVLPNKDKVYRVRWADNTQTWQLEEELGCDGLLFDLLVRLQVPRIQWPQRSCDLQEVPLACTKDDFQK